MRSNLFMLLALAWLASAAAHADARNDGTLARRGYLGVRLGPVDEAVRASRNLEPRSGVHVQGLLPDSPASGILQEGDVVLKIDGQDLEGADAVAQAVTVIGSHKADQEARFLVARAGGRQEASIRFKALPLETHEPADTEYTSVEVNGNRHRVIVTRPKSTMAAPAIFYLQGISCSSVDEPLTPESPIQKFLTEFSNSGFVTYRVEKSGIGDSQGPPCAGIDFATELSGYRAALEHLASLSYVDPNRIFLFGHSMGGVFAPVLAKDFPVRGVIVYGTIGTPLKTYFLENDARQLGLRGMSAAGIQRGAGEMTTFIDLFFVQQKTPADVLAEAPLLKGFLNVRDSDAQRFHGRHYGFWHQLDDIGLPSPWREVPVPSLILWGAADFAASRGDHVLIAETVNSIRPGGATFVELKDIGHGFDTARTMKDSMDRHMAGEFNAAAAAESLRWMRTLVD